MHVSDDLQPPSSVSNNIKPLAGACFCPEVCSCGEWIHTTKTCKQTRTHTQEFMQTFSSQVWSGLSTFSINCDFKTACSSALYWLLVGRKYIAYVLSRLNCSSRKLGKINIILFLIKIKTVTSRRNTRISKTE